MTTSIVEPDPRSPESKTPRTFAVKRLAAGLVLGVGMLAATPGIASAGSKAFTTSNGCSVVAANSYSGGTASARSKRTGGTCATLEVNFRYLSSPGIYSTASTGYAPVVDITTTKNTTSKPYTSNHNNQATTGGTKYGFPVSF